MRHIDEVTIRTLDSDGVEELLRSFEDSWAAQMGERITSAEFYDRYRAGAVDSMFAKAWATYYEVFQRWSRGPSDGVIQPIAATSPSLWTLTTRSSSTK